MGFFPNTPITDIVNKTEENKTMGRSLKFDFETKQFIVESGKLKETTKLESIEQWIQLCLLTYKDKFNIYKGVEFGCNIEDMVGEKINSFYNVELKREITESLLKNVYIKNINKIEIIKDFRYSNISLEIELIDGIILESVVSIK